MANDTYRRIIIRSDLDVNWKTHNPVPARNEILYVTDKGNFKVGDGFNHYLGLDFISTDGKFRGQYDVNKEYRVGEYVQGANGSLYRLNSPITSVNVNDPADDSVLWPVALIGVTDAQKSALAGTVGTPGATNKYVTDSDPRLLGAFNYRGIIPTPPTSQNVVAGEVWEDSVTGIPYVALLSFASTTPPTVGANWGLYWYGTQRQLGAPQWVAGVQVVGKLVYNNKLVYRVKQQPVTPSISPALDPLAYEEVGQSIQVNELHENKVIRITNNRERYYYTGIGTAANNNADDATQKALADAQPNDFIYVTTPLTLPFAGVYNALLQLKANVNLNMGGFSIFTKYRQDGIFPYQIGSGVIYGGGARIVCEGSYCFYTTASRPASYRILDLHFEGVYNPATNVNGGGAYITSGNYFHTGSIKAKSNDGKSGILAKNAGKYEFVGDITGELNSKLVEISNTSSVIIRNGKVAILSATAYIGQIYNSGTLEFGQCPIDLTMHPNGGGVAIMYGTTAATIILTDVTVFGGEIVSGVNGSKIILRGNTILPDLYGVDYLVALGMTVQDERIKGISTSSGGNDTTILPLPELNPTVNGAQRFVIPLTAVGVFDINVYESTGGVRPLYSNDYSVTAGALNFTAGANIKTTDKINGSYYQAGNTTGPSSGAAPNNFVHTTGNELVAGIKTFSSGITFNDNSTQTVTAIQSLLTGYAKSLNNRAITTNDSVLLALGLLEKTGTDNSINIQTNAASIVSLANYVSSLEAAIYNRYIISVDSVVRFYNSGEAALIAAIGTLQPGEIFSFQRGGAYRGYSNVVMRGVRVIGNYFTLAVNNGSNDSSPSGSGIYFDSCIVEDVNFVKPAAFPYTPYISVPNTEFRRCKIYDFELVSQGFNAGRFVGLTIFVDCDIKRVAITNNSTYELRGRTTTVGLTIVPAYSPLQTEIYLVAKREDDGFYVNPRSQIFDNTTQIMLKVDLRYIFNVRVPLTENKSFIYRQMVDGSSGSIWVTQDTTGGRTVTIDGLVVDTSIQTQVTNSYRVDPLISVNFIQPNLSPNAVTEMKWFWNGNIMYWNNRQY